MPSRRLGTDSSNSATIMAIAKAYSSPMRNPGWKQNRTGTKARDTGPAYVRGPLMRYIGHVRIFALQYLHL
jgi:hypothetical protein